MKKLLGISVIAMLAVAPAFADPVPGAPTHLESGTTITGVPDPEFALAMAADTDGNAASAGYVKGAYNAAIKAINKVNANTKTTAGDGLTKSDNTISVDLSEKSGLQLDGSTAGEKTLSVNVGNGIQKNATDGAVEVKAKSNSGIAVDSNGVAAVVDGTTIAVDSSNGAIKIVAGGVDTAQLAGSAVTTAKIADANVTADKLASNSVTTAKITDGNVTHAKLATDAVEAANIKNGEVTFVKMASGAVVTAGTSNNDKLTTQGYVDTAIDGLATDYAKKTNVVQTIKATTLNVADFTLTNGAVSGTASVPIQTNWAADTGTNLAVTYNLSVGTAITEGAVTVNPSSVSYNTVDCTNNANSDNAACLPQPQQGD